MEQNSSWRALSSLPHSWKHFPPSPQWGGKVQGATVPTEPGSWSRCVRVTGSGPFPAPRMESEPPSVGADVVPGLCTAGGGGPTHHVWLCASPGSVWKSQGLETGWEEAVPGAVPCWEGPACDSMTLLFPQLSATLTIPFWQWFLTRFGKKTAVYVGISVSVPSGVGCTWGWSLPHGMGRVPPEEPRAGQGLLLMTIWCPSLLLLFVLSWMCPRMCSAAVGLGEGRCTSGSLAVPSVGGLGYAGGGKSQGVWARPC